MDPLSFTASIIALLKLTAKVNSYLLDVRGAPEEYRRCESEVLNIQTLLMELRRRLAEPGQSEPWFAKVQELGIKDGPLDQYRRAVEQLQPMNKKGGKLKRAGDALLWTFRKEEVNSILGEMERLKSLIHIALDMDHL
jgi:hypothetical protein